MTARYLTTAEAATYLGYTVTALRHKVARLEVPFIRDGRNIRFDRLELDAHMAARRIPAETNR